MKFPWYIKNPKTEIKSDGGVVVSFGVSKLYIYYKCVAILFKKLFRKGVKD